MLYRAPAAGWSVERSRKDDSGIVDVRVPAGYCLLAANFALLLLPPVVGALVLLGLIR